MSERIIFNGLITLLLSTLLLPFAIGNIVMVMLCLYTLYFLIKNKTKPKVTLIYGVFWVLYVWMLLSWIWSIDRHLTVVAVWRNIHFFLIPLLFSFMPTFKSSDRIFIFHWFSNAMFGYALFFIMFAVFRFMKTGDTTVFSHHNLVSPLHLNRVMVSMFASFALMYAVWHLKKKWVASLRILVLSVFIILLTSKTIVITTVLMVFFLLAKRYQGFLNKKVIYILFVPAFIGVVFISNRVNKAFISEMKPRYHEILTQDYFGQGYYFNGAELRMLYARFLVEYNQESNIFFTGFGLNASQNKIDEKCIALEIHPGYGTAFNFHNQFIQFMSEIGIGGVLLLMFIVFYGIKYARKNKNNLMMAFLIAFTIYMMTDTPLNRQRGIYFFIVLYFLFISEDKKEIKAT